MQRREPAEPMRQFAAQISGGMLQRLDDVSGLFMTAEMGDEDLRMRQVRRDLDGGDRHHADARVLDVQAKQIGKLALNLVADALGALGVFFHNTSSRRRPGSKLSEVALR